MYMHIMGQLVWEETMKLYKSMEVFVRVVYIMLQMIDRNVIMTRKVDATSHRTASRHIMSLRVMLCAFV